MSGPAEMAPEDVPDESLKLFFRGVREARGLPPGDWRSLDMSERETRHGLAAVLPARDAAWLREAGGAVMAVVRVRALHKPVLYAGHPICVHCSGWNGVRCLGLMTPHPCSTITTIEGKTTGVPS